jgi:hypothetical protein
MKATISTIIAMITTTTTAFAANGDMVKDAGLHCWAFLGFCAIIVACQTVPAALQGKDTVKALLAKRTVTNKKA